MFRQPHQPNRDPLRKEQLQDTNHLKGIPVVRRAAPTRIQELDTEVVPDRIITHTLGVAPGQDRGLDLDVIAPHAVVPLLMIMIDVPDVMLIVTDVTIMTDKTDVIMIPPEVTDVIEPTTVHLRGHHQDTTVPNLESVRVLDHAHDTDFLPQNNKSLFHHQL